jgi:hypothetical protein
MANTEPKGGFWKSSGIFTHLTRNIQEGWVQSVLSRITIFFIFLHDHSTKWSLIPVVFEKVFLNRLLLQIVLPANISAID